MKEIVLKDSEKTVEIGNRRKNGNHADLKIVLIGKNIWKRPGEWRRLPVTQTTVTGLQSELA